MNILTDIQYIQSFIPLLLALLLAGCGRDEGVGVPGDEGGGVRIGFSVRTDAGAVPQSRVLGDQETFPAGSYRFGTWICYQGTFEPSRNGYGNLQTDLTVSSDGNQTWSYTFENRPFTTLNVSHGIPIDIYMFYPRPTTGEQATLPDEVPFTSGKSDWMWTKTSLGADNLRGDHVDVPLVFDHAMTCFRIGIKSRYPGSSLSSITLHDKQSRLYARGLMNLAAQELVLKDADRTDELKLSVSALLTTQTQYFYLFMPPVGYDDGELFTLSFVFNGNPAKTEFTIPRTITDKVTGNEITISEFERGKRYTYTLTLDNSVVFTPVAVDDNWETVYEDWEL